MRKFLLRWWYTPNWRADTYHRMMLDWNGNWLTRDGVGKHQEVFREATFYMVDK